MGLLTCRMFFCVFAAFAINQAHGDYGVGQTLIFVNGSGRSQIHVPKVGEFSKCKVIAKLTNGRGSVYLLEDLISGNRFQIDENNSQLTAESSEKCLSAANFPSGGETGLFQLICRGEWAYPSSNWSQPCKIKSLWSTANFPGFRYLDPIECEDGRIIGGNVYAQMVEHFQQGQKICYHWATNGMGRAIVKPSSEPSGDDLCVGDTTIEPEGVVSGFYNKTYYDYLNKSPATLVEIRVTGGNLDMKLPNAVFKR